MARNLSYKKINVTDFNIYDRIISLNLYSFIEQNCIDQDYLARMLNINLKELIEFIEGNKAVPANIIFCIANLFSVPEEVFFSGINAAKFLDKDYKH